MTTVELDRMLTVLDIIICLVDMVLVLVVLRRQRNQAPRRLTPFALAVRRRPIGAGGRRARP